MVGTVLFCGAWDEGPGYPRTTALRQGLQAQGIEVVDCRLPALGGPKQRLLTAPWRWPGFVLGWLLRRLRLRQALRAALRRHRPGLVLVPYPGHLVVDTVRQLSPVPVVLDLFLSAYDTAVVDRGLFQPGSLLARLLLALDRRACSAADLVLVDTPANVDHMAALTGLPGERFDWLPVADPEAPAVPPPYVVPAPGDLELLFFGTGVPLHGLQVLIDAVAAASGVRLCLVGGTAAERDHARQVLGSRLELQPPFVDRQQLALLLARAGLVAGVFGGSPKAQRVVPFKVVHALAAGRPVVTADTTAIRAVPGAADCMFLVAADDPRALAATLTDLSAAPERLAVAAAHARAVYEQQFAVERTGSRLAARLERLCAAVEPS